MIILPFPSSALAGHNKGQPWTKHELAALRAAYAAGRGVADISQTLGRSKSSIRNQAYKLGVTTRDDSWSDAEIVALKAAYAGDKKKGQLDLDALSVQFGRSKSGICVKARKLGLTDIRRKGIPKPKLDKRKFKTEEARSAARSENLRRRHRETPHPMLGRKHSEATLEKMAEASCRSWAAKSDEAREAVVQALMKGKFEKYGSLANPRPSGSWKAGWREIGVVRKYYRSRWEANYARYLEWLRQRGEIKDWAHEPETFWFEAIKRGVRSYLPDFRVWENDGSSKLHEVKGWMDSRSKTTLARMKKYHPNEQIIVIRERDYNSIARAVSRLIEGWEHSDRSNRP